MDVRREEIVNDRTGEVLYEKTSYIPELFNNDGYYFWKKKSQSRQFTGIELPLKNFEEEGIFGRMCRLYLSNNSNFLEVPGRNNIRPFDVDDLADMMNVSLRQAQRRLKSFLDSGVLAKLTVELRDSKEEWLVVNPLYFISGNRINDTLYKLFRKDLDNYLSPFAKKEFAKRIESKVKDSHNEQ
jgi:hypothetical protein